MGKGCWFPHRTSQLTRWACEITMHVLLFSVIPTISHSVLSFLNCFVLLLPILYKLVFLLVLVIDSFLKKGGVSVLSGFDYLLSLKPTSLDIGLPQTCIFNFLLTFA